MKKLISLILCVALLAIPCVSAVTYQGVDIYHGTSSNGQVNWAGLSQQKQFVYIKCSEGEHSADSMFEANIGGAKSVGMKWGAYHFLRMYSPESAVKQADYFYSRIKGTEYSIIPCVDCESHDGQRKAAGIRACIRAFIDEFYKLSGMKPVIYCSTDYANTILRGQFSDCRLWQADYRGYAGAAAGWKTYSAWQYSENGNIPAIANREVDLDMSGGGIFMQSAAKQQTAKAVKNGVYTVKKMPYKYNATAKKSAQVYTTQGDFASGHTVYSNDRICVIGVDYFQQLLEIVYPTSSGYIHGYIKNTGIAWRYSGRWHNGSTFEKVYDGNKESGTIFPWEKAAPLYATSGGYAVIYSTNKGYNTKSGIVKYHGRFKF